MLDDNRHMKAHKNGKCCYRRYSQLGKRATKSCCLHSWARSKKKSTSQIVRDYTRRDDISKVALAPKCLKWHWLLVFQIQKKLKTTGLHATTKQNRCTQTNLMFSFSFSFRLALLPLFIFQDFRIISVLCLCGPHFH